MSGTHKVIRSIIEVLEDVHGEPGVKLKPSDLATLFGMIHNLESFYIEYRILPRKSEEVG